MLKQHKKDRKLLAHLLLKFLNFLSAWRKDKAIKKPWNELTNGELINILHRFYVKACSHDGNYYSRDSMKAVRAGPGRCLNKQNISFSIVADRDLMLADTLNAHLIGN